MFLVPDDLTAFADIDPAKAATMIADAQAMATLAAPCLSTPEFQSDETRVAAVKAILRGALIRWHEAGSGVVAQQSAGPFAQTLDTRQQRRGMFWPSEIAQLRDICSAFSGGSGGAFMIDMTGAPAETNPLAGAVINTAEGGPTPMGSWSDEQVPFTGLLP